MSSLFCDSCSLTEGAEFDRCLYMDMVGFSISRFSSEECVSAGVAVLRNLGVGVITQDPSEQTDLLSVSSVVENYVSSCNVCLYLFFCLTSFP